MPRLPENVSPAYRLHRASGQAVVTLNGRDIYLGRWEPETSRSDGGSRDEYDRVVGEWVQHHRRLTKEFAPPPLEAADDRITIDELIHSFWEYVQQHYRHTDGTQTGEAENFRYALRALREIYKGIPAEEFSPRKLKTVRAKMVASGWCRKHVNKQIGRIRAMFSWAIEEELIENATFTND